MVVTRYIVRIDDPDDLQEFANERSDVLKVLPRIHMVILSCDEYEADEIREDPRVEWIEEDEAGDPAASPQTIVNEWHLDRIDQRELPLDDEYHWEHDGTGVIVYVIDSGIRGDHQEFTGRLLTGYSAVDGSPYTDVQGHGTGVAGAIAGATTGPARGASIVSVKVWSTGLIQAADLADGVDWILANHDFNVPAIANISLSWPGSTTVDDITRSLVEAGITVTTAATNTDALASTRSPARMPEVITVSSTDTDDSFRVGHNYGSAVDILAPGSGVWTPSNDSSSAYSAKGGTSYAAPIVGGIAAMLLEQDPTLSPGQVRAFLVAHSTHGKITNLPPGTPNRLAYSGVTPDIAPPPSGNVFVKTGVFAKRTGTGTQSISWSADGSWDGSAAPKAILFWLNGVNDANIDLDTPYNQNRIFFGVATADDEYCFATVQRHASSSLSVIRSIRSDNCIFVQDVGNPNVPASTLAIAVLSSFDTNGFTVNWTRNENTFPYRIHYLAIGGDGITDAILHAWNVPSSGMSTQDGLDFTDPLSVPECLIHLNSGGISSLVSGSDNFQTTGTSLGIGVATRSGEQWAYNFFGGTGTTSNSRRLQRTNATIVGASTGSDGISYIVEHVEMLPGGFTSNVLQNAGSNQQIITLAIVGGIWSADSLLQPTSTGTQVIDELPADPKGILFGSFMRAPSEDGEVHARFMVGATDGTSQNAVMAIHPSGLSGTFIVSRNLRTDTAIILSESNILTPEAVASATLGEESFSLDWTTADATQREVLWLSVGEFGPDSTFIDGIGTSVAHGLGLTVQPITIDGIGTSAARGLGEAIPIVVVDGIGNAIARGLGVVHTGIDFPWTFGRSGAVGIGHVEHNRFIDGFARAPAHGFGSVFGNPFIDGIARAAGVGIGSVGGAIVFLDGIGQAPATGVGSILKIIALSADVEGRGDVLFAFPVPALLSADVEGRGTLLVVSMGKGMGPIIGAPVDPLGGHDHVRKFISQLREGDTVRVHIPWGDIEGTTRLARVSQRRVETGDEQQRLEFHMLAEDDQVVEAIKDGEPLRYAPKQHQEASRQVHRSRRYINERGTRGSIEE